MRKASLLRIGSVTLAMLGGIALAHCGGGDDTTVTPDQDTGIDETSMSETGDETSTDTGTNETSTDTGTDETSADGGDATTDGGDATADATDTGTADTALPDVVIPDGADAAVVCGTLSGTATDVYVNKASSLPSVGTVTCPFHTIKEATDLAAVSGRTIHVKGGTSAAPANYTESGALLVKTGVSLVGDGLAVTKITNQAACSGGGNCAVEVQGGATIDGFAVNGTGSGIVTSASDVAATVRNVSITVSQDGILALGSATLAGEVQANGNGGNGLHANSTTARTVTISGTGNQFDTNTQEGILVEGSSRLNMTGGEASTNKTNGIHLRSTTGKTGTDQNVITGASVRGNGTGTAGNGIVVETASSLKLRNTVVLENKHNGLVVIFGTGTNALDIGNSVTDPGGNTFSVPATGSRNSAAGVCLENSGATASQPGEGNKWAACALTTPAVVETSITGNCTSNAGLAEIAYKKSSAGGTDPVAITPATGCSVGTP